MLQPFFLLGPGMSPILPTGDDPVGGRNHEEGEDR
jgi:hypothetical protein